MPAVIRKTVDSAGGILIEASPDVFVNSYAAVRIGDAVQPHGDGPHAGPVMAEGSSTVFVNSIPLCRQGDLATCGHPAGPGSPDTFAGG